MKKLVLLAFFIQLVIAGFAQMTDEQVVNLLKEARNQGKSQQEMIIMLSKRGVTQEQLMRIKNEYSKTGMVGTSYTAAGKSRMREEMVESGTMDSIGFGVAENTEGIQKPLKTQGLVFGREIFRNRRLNFEPNLNIATPENYVLGSGDEVIIDLWGNTVRNIRQEITPDGNITIDETGPIYLNGLKIEEAYVRVKNALSNVYASLKDDEPNTFMKLSLGKVRSIRVNVMGEVALPGTYTLPSFATLFNALYAAGGVNEIGSLRGIKVYRNSKEVAKLDVYDYLLNGKYNTNIRLEENDMVIVSPYDQLAVVRGKVKRNRIFELKKGETLKQLLNMAGGFTGDAYRKDVRVKRKAGSRYQIATVTEDKYPTFAMMDGDSLLVDSVIPFYENRLTVTGAVWRPGEYELNGAVHTVRQLVDQAAGLKGDEFAGRAQITRLNPDFTTTVVAVDIRGILNGTSPDIELKPEDILNIPSLFDLREPYTIKVSGAVNYVDTVLPYRNNLTVEDAIMMAGGLKESAATVNVEVARRIKDTKTYENTNRTAEVFNFELNDNLGLISTDGKKSDKVFTLDPFDEVYERFSTGYQ